MSSSFVIRSRAPLRISFAGGGTDVSPYLEEKGGAVLNSTINRFAYATIIPKSNKEVEIASLDYDVILKYTIDKEIAFDGQLDLIKGVINKFRSRYGLNNGFRIFVHSDAPPGSGLGSSSAIAVAVIVAFAKLVKLPLTPYELAELAYEIERVDVGIKGGKQDQYASSFGGMNFIEFNKDITVVNPLRIEKSILNELEYSLILGYIGSTRASSKIIEKQIKNYEEKQKDVVSAMDNIKKLAFEMKNALLRGELHRFGELLNEEWHEKKKMAEGISNEIIDRIYEEALKAGAIGGKISGAGGGGFMFFYTEFDKKVSVINRLKELGVQVLPFSFVEDGATAWEVKNG
jgi:D-glycero-alpha-D-manno-heptose-7-phosphate kinase